MKACLILDGAERAEGLKNGENVRVWACGEESLVVLKCRAMAGCLLQRRVLHLKAVEVQ